MDFSVNFSPEDLDEMRTSQDALTPEVPIARHLAQVRDGSGALRWVDWSVRALFGPDGRVAEFQTVGRDVTEDYERRRELLVKESAIASSVDGIAIVDPDGSIEYVNQAFATMFGYGDPGELAGTACTPISPRATPPSAASLANSRRRSSAKNSGSVSSGACGATGGRSWPRSRPRWRTTTTVSSSASSSRSST